MIQNVRQQAVCKAPAMNFKGKKQKELTKEEKELIKKSSPALCGIGAFLIWGAGGFALERLGNKAIKNIFKIESALPLKISLILNGAFGLISGVATYFNVRKAKKKLSTELNTNE